MHQKNCSIPFCLAKMHSAMLLNTSQTVCIYCSVSFCLSGTALYTLPRVARNIMQRENYAESNGALICQRKAVHWRAVRRFFDAYCMQYMLWLKHHMPFLHQACLVQSTSPTPSPYLPYLEIQYASKKLFYSVLFSKNEIGVQCCWTHLKLFKYTAPFRSVCSVPLFTLRQE